MFTFQKEEPPCRPEYSVKRKGCFRCAEAKGRSMKYYLMDQEDALRALHTPSGGLSRQEAETRLTQYGFNVLSEGKKTPVFFRFLRQFSDPMVIVLLAAAILSGLTAQASGESGADVLIILFVVVLNAVLGVVQESKAERALAALKKLSPAEATVVREGTLERIPAERLVPGDIVLLEAGDAVPADGRVLESVSLKTEEAALTGESLPADKTDARLTQPADGTDIAPGDRKNTVFMGSGVVYGRGRMLVTETGMHTEMGRIAHAINGARRGETPLQKKLASLSKTLTVLVLLICAAMFVIGILKEGTLSLPVILSTFMLSVSLAVAAIPEGLAAVVTIVLSIGVTRMAARRAIVRRLSSVETLGCTQVICTDKTGTLTQNSMTVVNSIGNSDMLASVFCLCTEAEIRQDGGVYGEPTEAALLHFAIRCGADPAELRRSMPRIGEIPFDSRRKMMSTVHRSRSGIIQFTKGAPDALLERCTRLKRGSETIPMTAALRAELLAENRNMASRALRVIAGAYRMHAVPPASCTPEELERNLIFIGLAGMADPVRQEVPAAVFACRSAGIRPIMITGDHPDTAIAVAREAGILQDPGEAISGAELDRMSEEALAGKIERYSVYARVRPEHKVRIVEAWKKRGMVTAMTGDGINDAPALKSADIGIGMGISGTDVTKNVADIILSDDNFATIVSAVEEGRRVYDNIRKAIRFLLSSNLSEVLCIFAATISGFQILLPVHLLFINLITDSLPALALGLEKEEPDIMRRMPRESSEGLFSGGVGLSCIYQGFMVAALTMGAFLVGISGVLGTGVHENPLSAGMTMAFLTMSMAEIFHSYNMRAQFGSIFRLKTHNFWLFGAMLLSLLLTSALIFVPQLRALFRLEQISASEYLFSLLLSSSVIPIVELIKALTAPRHTEKNQPSFSKKAADPAGRGRKERTN